MYKTAIFLTLLAAAALWVLYGMWVEGRAVTPENLLASAEERIRVDGDLDFDSALYEIDLAMRLAEEQGDREAVVEALQLHADVMQRRGAPGRALDTYQRLQADYLPDDIGVAMSIAQLQVSIGELDRARRTTETVLAELPLHNGAWALLGRIHNTLAEETMARVDEVLVRNLADEQLERARDLALRAASRPLSDPARVALVSDLVGLFGPLAHRDRSTVEIQLEEASTSFEQAFDAYVEALSRRANTTAMIGFLRILTGAGRHREAVAFGLAAFAHEQFQQDRNAADALARSLFAMGNARHAVLAIQAATDAGHVPAGMLVDWCRILYEARAWKPLSSLARELASRASGPERRWRTGAALFYQGMADLGRDSLAPGLQRLTQYLELSEEPEETDLDVGLADPEELAFDEPETETPFEGARLEALLAIAAAHHKRKSDWNELLKLREAVELDPDGSDEAWYRLYQIETKLGETGPVKLVSYLTHAMRHSPVVNDRMFDDWERVGRAALTAERKDPDNANAPELRSESKWYPDGDPGPYELFLLAKKHRQAGFSQGSVVCLQLLLSDYPGFLPAQDELIDLYLDVGRWDEAGPLLLDRIARWGAGTRELEVLRRIPPGVLSLEQKLERIDLDPGHTGALAVTEHLRSTGEPERALRALQTVGYETLGTEGRLLAGEILLDLGRTDEVFEALVPIAPQDTGFSRANSIRIRAALRAEDSELLLAAIREMVESERLNPKEVTALSDDLVERGDLEAAEVLLARLDSGPQSRDGAVFLRQAALHLQAGEAEAAREDLIRAEAYLERGEPYLGQILVAAELGDWRAVPGELSSLRNSGWRGTPLQQVVLLAFEDRLEDSRARLEAGLAEFPEGEVAPAWVLVGAALSTLDGTPPEELPLRNNRDRRDAFSLVTGPPGRARDARGTLALVLGLESTIWRPWVLNRLGALEATGDTAANPWVPYLAAECAWRMQRPGPARSACERALALRESFAPAWALLERMQLARLGPGHPDVLDLRARARAALGEPETELAEGVLLEAGELSDQGKLEEALVRVKWALRLDPKLAEARRLLARLQTEKGQWKAAVGSYERLFEILDRQASGEVVPEFVAALQYFVDEELMTPGEAVGTLTPLLRKLPEDPGLVLGMARFELRAAGENVPAGVARVWRRLDEFLERTSGRSLESLQPGSTARWFDFALALDPRRAEEIVWSQLEYAPSSPDLRLLLGRALEAQYRPAEALAHYEALRTLLPEEQIVRSSIGLMVDLAEKPQDIEAVLFESVDLNDWDVDDPFFRFLLARAYSAGGPVHLEKSVEILGILWDDRESIPEHVVPRAVLGQSYGEALLRRGLRDDRKLAEEVLDETLAALPPGPDRELCLALRQLAPFLPRSREDLPSEEPAEETAVAR